MDDSGYIYILINPSMEGLVKIGKTKRDPKERVKELSSVTGVPTPFILIFDAYFDNCSKAEDYVHTLLEQKNYRVSTNREFFNVPPNEAIKAILDAQSFFAIEKISDSQFTAKMESNPQQNSWIDLLSLAESYEDGIGETLQDVREALRLYKQAAKLGSPEACYKIGCIVGGIYRNNAEFYDARQAIEYFQEGGKRGFGESYAEMTSVFIKIDQIQNALKCWKKYFESPSFFQKTHNRGLYGGIYLEQVKFYGFPLNHFDEIFQIRDEILEDAKQRLVYNQNQQKSTDSSEGDVRHTLYVLYPELARNTENGCVKWYDNDKGYGFIYRNSGAEIFLHQSEIINKIRPLQSGDSVEFEVGELSQSPRAYNVRIL